jgi:hypothetical protein
VGGGKERPARKTDNLTAICEPIVWKLWEPRRLTTLWAFTACYRDNFTLTARSETLRDISYPDSILVLPSFPPDKHRGYVTTAPSFQVL